MIKNKISFPQRSQSSPIEPPALAMDRSIDRGRPVVVHGDAVCNGKCFGASMVSIQWCTILGKSYANGESFLLLHDYSRYGKRFVVFWKNIILIFGAWDHGHFLGVETPARNFWWGMSHRLQVLVLAMTTIWTRPIHRWSDPETGQAPRALENHCFASVMKRP